MENPHEQRKSFAPRGLRKQQDKSARVGMQKLPNVNTITENVATISSTLVIQWTRRSSEQSFVDLSQIFCRSFTSVCIVCNRMDPGLCSQRISRTRAFRLVAEDNATFQDNSAVSMMLISKRGIAGYANNRFPPPVSPTLSIVNLSRRRISTR